MKINFRIIMCFLVALLIISLLFGVFACRKKERIFTPESRDMQPDEKFPTIIIDAGHGGEDSGTVGADGTLEKNLNLEIAKTLTELLRSNGFDVVLTRDEDILLYDRNSDYLGHKKRQDMAKRLEIAQQYPDAVFVSIHMNSFPQIKYRGLQVYYSPNSPRSELLASGIQQNVRTNLQSDNARQIKSSDGNIYLLDKLTCPAVLIECGFLSNPEECALLNDENYRQRLCVILYSSIETFLK